MNKLSIALGLLAFAWCPVFADDDQQEMRINPEIETLETTAPVNYDSYSFLNLSENYLNMNGDDWSELAKNYEKALNRQGRFNVVYLGDSHVQADYGGRELRKRLSQDASAGRGLMIPFRAAGTNQPTDYSLSFDCEVNSSRLLKTPWTSEMPFTGIGVQPLSPTFKISFTSPTEGNIIRIHTTGTQPIVTDMLVDGESIHFMPVFADVITFRSPIPSRNFEISLEGDATTTIGAAELLSDTHGVLVHSIGNNGATYSSYNSVPNFAEGIATLSPDLIVIALGTNEAFGNSSSEDISADIQTLVGKLKKHNPHAKIMLVGPAQCYKKTVKVTGRRRRRRKSTVMAPNQKVAVVARTVRNTAEHLHLPYYNMYAIAGTPQEQTSASLLRADGVHYSAQGYALWGNLLSDAILKKLKP